MKIRNKTTAREKNGIRIKVEVMREAVREREKESNVGRMRIQNKDIKKESLAAKTEFIRADLNS